MCVEKWGVPSRVLPTQLVGVNRQRHLSSPPPGRKRPTNKALPKASFLSLDSRLRAMLLDNSGGTVHIVSRGTAGQWAGHCPETFC